jgi:hypothetical protein
LDSNIVNNTLPFEENNEEEVIEVLDDPKRTTKDVIVDTANKVQEKAETIKTNIQNQDIYESSTEAPVIKERPKKKIDTLLKIQIVLIVLWIVLTISIYFWGYDLFEKLIPIS